MRLIIADDNQVFRSHVRKFLIEHCEDDEIVGEAEDGLAVLHLLDHIQADLLLLDIEMPVMTGIDVLRKLKELDRPIIVLMISTYVDQDFVFEALKLGAAGYLVKDDFRNEIKKAINSVRENAGRPAYVSQSVQSDFNPSVL